MKKKVGGGKSGKVAGKGMMAPKGMPPRGVAKESSKMMGKKKMEPGMQKTMDGWHPGMKKF